LLRLPPELRNIIYGYVLAEAGGLHYLFPGQGAHRLYSPTTMTPAKRSWPRFAGEANQLKYVCHQLWHETRGYGLKFNPLTIRRFEFAHPHEIAQTVTFLKSVGKEKMKSLRFVNISQACALQLPSKAQTEFCCVGCGTGIQANCPTLEAELQRTATLLKCAHFLSHIQFNIHINLPPCGFHCMPPCAAELILHVLRYLLVFRGMAKQMSDLGFLIPDEDMEWVKKMQFGVDPQVLNAPNVRFYLPHGWVNPKTVVWDFREVPWLEELGQDFAGGVDGAVKVVEGWYKHGF
jgi:hypothetical protein